MYGPTETTIWSSVSLVEAEGPVTIGKPIGNTQMYILDDNLNPAPLGVPGELCIGGDGLADGYFNRDELTADKFIPHPFADDGSRIYKTGDLARYLPNGDIECLGRNDHQVKIRGYRMELGEIETALTAHPAVKESVVTAHEYREGDTRLVAYVMTDSSGITEAQIEKWKGEHLDQWKDLWEGAYVDGGEVPDPRFNISGWNSSYDGQAIPASDMRAWVDSTAERILSYTPQRALEIGAGTGLFVSRIAPHTSAFVATDFSPASVSAIEQLHNRYDDLKQVSALQCAADQLDALAEQRFDTVIINSVAQYFPDAAYMQRVLNGLIDRIDDGGRIFLGDIRNLALLQTFHTSVQSSQAEASDTLEELGQRIRQRVEQEEELLFDAAFFAGLKQQLNNSRIRSVSLQLKDGEQRNELVSFRYDVVIHIGSDNAAAAKPEQLDWQTAGMSPEQLQDRIAGLQGDGLLVTNIPDRRITAETQLTAYLAQEPSLTSGEALARIDNNSGIEPAALFAMAEAAGVRVESIATTAGYMNFWFAPKDCTSTGGLLPCINTDAIQANDPMAGRLQRSLVPELRDSLKQRLPDYMVPGVYSLLEEFPLTPNGKIDRKALPVPEGQITQTYVPPESDTEKSLTAIWEDILSAGQVGIDDDFFDLGGHSLLATQLISRIRDGLNVNLPLNALFETPTVRGLASAVDTLHWALNEETTFAEDADIEEIEL